MTSETQSNIVPLYILLAYDGSKHAQAAVDLLRSLPLKNPTITCLAVMGTQKITSHEALQESLDDAGKQLSSRGWQVETQLKAGNPADSINNFALEHKIDLTMIGARGLRATLGILLGGVAQQVVEYSHCPVMVVREPFSGVHKVLVVSDGSEYSKRAINYLAPPPTDLKPHLALPNDVDMRLMYVLPPEVPPELATRAWNVGPEVMYPVPAKPLDWERIEMEEERQGKAILAEGEAHLQGAGYQVKQVLVRGDAATEIIEYIRQHEIDLVVCGSRGLNPVTSWLLGSVSRKLVHYAGCSVLIVK